MLNRKITLEEVEILIDPPAELISSEVPISREDTDIETMSTDSLESAAYKGIPTFDGKKEKFQKFLLKFKVYANAKSFKNALTRATALLPDDPNAAGLTDDETKRIKDNNNAVCALTMALTGDEVFEIVANSMTEDYPDGEAWRIMEDLLSEFQPNDGTSRLEFLNALNQVKLGKKKSTNKDSSKLKKASSKYSRSL